MATSTETPETTIIKRRENPVGILRLDFGKPRRLSAEFKTLQGEPASPQPSVDRLSVTFADESVRSDSSTRCNYFNPVLEVMDGTVNDTPDTVAIESDEEDYSASVNAIFQRRASTKRSRRRGRRSSSPFSPDYLPESDNERRRSSVFTTSSGETAITMDENVNKKVTQEEIFENIKLHKEVLSNVKMQPWNMRKKLKLVIQAKAYIKKHEGVLQERLAQSRSTRDMLARWNIVLVQKWQHCRREMMNLSMWFIPWELKIKEIESHFGSVVASYFIFLRWLFWVNVVISVVLISFVAIPEMLIGNPKAPDRNVLPEEKYNATNFMTLWEFDGVLKYSPLFYGWYESNSKGYRLAIAYFITGLIVYAYSFFATLRKMAENSRMSKLSEKDDECIFSWKLFTAWDYMIGNAETAHNRVASIVMGFKEALLEEAEKKKDTRNWKVIGCRVFVNLVVMGLLSLSVYLIILVVDRSTQSDSQNNFWRKNETSFVIALITFFFPMVFEVLGLLEQHHPRKQLRLQLARIMVLNLLNLYSLIYALVERISGMTEKLEAEWNISKALNKSSYLYTAPSSNMTKYYNETCLPCGEHPSELVAESLISELRKNLTIEFPASFGDVMEDLMTKVVAANATLQDFSNGTFLENFAYLVEDLMQKVTALNETLLDIWNGTRLENITRFENDSIFNETYGNYPEMNFTEAKGLFVDYLTYILYSVDAFYSTIIPDENSTTASSDYNYTTMNPYYNYTTLIPGDNDTALYTTEFSNFKMVSHFSTKIIPFIEKFTELTNFTELTTSTELTSTELTKYVELTEANRFDTSTSMEDILSTISTEKCVDCRKVWIAYKPNYTRKAELRNLCWETMFGQELVKLTVTDLFMSILPTLGMEFFRGIFVRVMNRCWCWDLEKIFPQYADFKVAENILALVNNQGIVWMGMFFSPGIVALNVAKLYILMYFRAWAVLTCNSPPEVIFRASRSHNFYYALLLMMLFLCVLPVGYTIVWIRPSWHCGPFRKYPKISHIFTETIKENSPARFWKVLDYIASPGIVIPLLVLLTLIIYYLVSLTSALREANEDLKIQLRRERTEERRKMFQMSDRRRRVGSGESNELSNTPFNKWKKVLGNLPSGKSMDETPKPETDDIPEPAKEENGNKSRDFFTKLIKRALGKSSTSEDEQNAEDGTDTEQHDSLPDDTVSSKKGQHKTVRPTFSWGRSDFQSVATKAMHLKTSNPDPNSNNTVNVVEPKLEKSSANRRNSDLRRDVHRKKKVVNRNEPSTSDSMRQDSETSVRSEQIPVITISKTDSAENILKANMPSISGDEVERSTQMKYQQKYAPKIKCALKKQSAEVDEETIRYFSRNIEESQNENDLLKALAGESVADAEGSSQRRMFFENLDHLEEPLTDVSSSEGTEYRESSTDTVLHSPITKREQQN